MSIRVMTRVWDESPFDQTTLLVLLALADHADDDGRCWPAIPTIARKARCSERWARQVIAELEESGWLTRDLRPGNSTLYRIVFPATPEPQFTPEQTSPLNPSSSPPRNPSSPHPGTPVPMNHKEPSLEPSLSSPAILAVDAPTVSDVVLSLCDHLADRVAENTGKRPRITKRWHDAARLMLERDKYTPDQIRGAITWCQDSEFWRANVLSMPTLREKYPTLRLHAQRGTTKRPSVVGERRAQALHLIAEFEQAEAAGQ